MLAAADKRTPSSYVSLADTHPACTPANDHHYPHPHHLAPARAPGSKLYEEFHPFGTTSYAANDSGIEVSAKRYRYIGKERDEETGLYHCGARYLAAWLGRWTAADPIGLGDGVNRYAYARGNPVRLVDTGGTKAGQPDEPRILRGDEPEIQGKVFTEEGGKLGVRDMTPTEVEAGREHVRRNNERRARATVQRTSVELAPGPAPQAPPIEEWYPEIDVVPGWLLLAYPPVGATLLMNEGIANAPRDADLSAQYYGRGEITGNPDDTLRAAGLLGKAFLELAPFTVLGRGAGTAEKGLQLGITQREIDDLLRGEFRVPAPGSAAGEGANLPVKYDPDFAAAQLLGWPTNITPGGRSITAHAAERMTVNPGPGRVPASIEEVDAFLDTATQVRKFTPDAQGGTLTLRNANSDLKEVAVDAATGKRVVTVIKPRKRP